jgi:hypothetical protein
MRAHFLTLPAAIAASAIATLAAPLAGQSPPGSFSLPTPSPTPTPAPQGPADERSGIEIPPRPIGEPRPSPAPTPAISPAPLPSPVTIPAPAATASPRPSPAPAQTTPSPATEVPAAPVVAPEDPAETAPLDDPGDAQSFPAETDVPASTALGGSILPDSWVLAAGLAALALLLAAVLALLRRRRRHARPLQLAAPAKPAVPAEQNRANEPARIDWQLDIISATRSLMMFTLEYRLELANRSDRGINDVRLAARLACAQRGTGNAPPAGTAQDLQTIPRIGAQQSRSITGTLRLAVADIAALRQGSTPMFVPLIHVTLEGDAISQVTRTYVVGTQSSASVGRLQPILLDTPPGGIPGMRTQLVQLPAASGAS